MTDDRKTGDAGSEADDTPPNQAPDAVKDPNEKTDGKPGEPSSQHGDEDPGAG